MPAFLLGQATPDPRDLPGAQREDPAPQKRGARRADRLGPGDQASPGNRTLGVRAEERPVAHPLARDRRPTQAGVDQDARSTGTSGSRRDTRWIRRWRDPVRRVGRVRHRAGGGDRDRSCPAHGLFVSDHKTRFLFCCQWPDVRCGRNCAGVRSRALAGSPVRLAAFRGTPPQPGDGNG